jgi:hypothetical protein
MGTGFSLDPNEFRTAATVIEGYGADQADHGTTLAAGTSTPLSSSGSGISGAISQIAQATVQKIVTDVTSTTQGFANDTAKGLRTQADNADQLETDLAGHAKSLLSDTQASLLGGSLMSVAQSSLLGRGGGGGGGYPTSGMPTTVNSPLTTGSSPLGGSSLGESDLSSPGLSESGSSSGGAAAVGPQEPQESTVLPSEGMRGSTGADAGAGAADERGQRPDYLKSKTELSNGHDDRTKAAIDKHLQECGAAPIPLSPSRLVCAKCGSMLEIGDAQALTA